MSRRALSPLEGITERCEDGLTVLVRDFGPVSRRVLFVNSYGGAAVWEKVKRGLIPPHHMWGCLELVRMGYEVALAEPLRHFYLRRNPIPHDLKYWRMVRQWLRPDDILYCGHTLLYWIPLLKKLGAIKCRIVSLTYAREELDYSGAHSGIIALTPAAADQARKIAPKARVAHLSWGCDLNFFPELEYDPQWFLSCGITHRDFLTLSIAARRCSDPLRLICPGHPSSVNWSPNVAVIDGGNGLNHEKSEVSYDDLIHEHYAGTIASLIVLKPDPTEYTAIGFTNLLEAMALARPVIVTRTGALPGELDVEAAGCGLYVPPGNPDALTGAIQALAGDADRAKEMGACGRRLAESYYNIERYGTQLHEFFESL